MNGSPDTSKSNNNNKIPCLEDFHYFMLTKEFDSASTSEAIAFIIQRNLMPVGERPDEIKFIINSQGGELSSSFALIDTMMGSRVPISTFGLGLVASCALMTFISGRKGRRFITTNTAILSHQYSWINIGKEHELFATVKEITNTGERCLHHYRRCTGLSEKRIKEILLPPQDVWLSAKEAVRYGLADKIVDFYNDRG